MKSQKSPDKQKSSKRFYFAFILLIFVSSLSYFSFSQYAPNIEAKSKEEVKGSQSEHPFSFVPDLPNAQSRSSNHSYESFERSFIKDETCSGEAQKFYTTVLEDNKWKLERTEEKENFVGKTYKKDNQKITVSTFNNPEKEECLIILVGFSSN